MVEAYAPASVGSFYANDNAAPKASWSKLSASESTPLTKELLAVTVAVTYIPMRSY